MKKLAVTAALMCMLAAASSAAAASLEELYVYPFVESFTWSEFAGDGSRLLKETGPLFGAGTQARLDLYRRKLLLRAKGELFGGEVDYDGQAQSDTGATFPIKTRVTYFGTRLESDAKWRFDAAPLSIEPFAGLGYRYWLRDLHDSGSGNQSVSGYTEEWQSFYGRIGIGAEYAAAANLKIFAEGGGKYPFYNENRADYPGAGTVSIRPGSEWSGFAELGARYKRLRAGIYYEGFRFSQSPAVPVAARTFLLQPRSESDIFGLRVGWCFF